MSIFTQICVAVVILQLVAAGGLGLFASVIVVQDRWTARRARREAAGLDAEWDAYDRGRRS